MRRGLLTVIVFTLPLLAAACGAKLGSDIAEAERCRCSVGWITYP